MIESFHNAINALIGVFVPFFRQVQIDHGGFEATVPQVALDDTQINAGLQQMSGIACEW